MSGQPRTRRGSRPALVVALVAVLVGCGGVAWAVVSSGVLHWEQTPVAVPGSTRLRLEPGRYVVFERTGSIARTGPVTRTVRERPSLNAKSIRITDPNGTVVPAGRDGATETITNDTEIFTSAVLFEATVPGDYLVTVTDPGDSTSAFVAPSIGGAFFRAGGGIALAFIAGLAFVTSIAVWLRSWIRSAPRPAPRPVGSAGP